MKKKTSLLIACSCLLAGGVTAGAVVASQELKESEALTGTFVPSGTIKDSYSVGETISIPEGQIQYKGSTIAPKSRYIVNPNGIAYNAESLIFEFEGNYQVVYEGIYDGKTVNAYLNLIAYKKAYQVSKEGSYARFTDQIITNQTKTAGIEGYLVEGDSFVYGNVIDISKSDLDTPVIKYYTHTWSELAEHIGVDAYYSVVRLTDYYDPSIYVDISIGHYEANHSTGRQQQYAVAGASNQSMTGCIKSSSTATGTRKNVTIDDENYLCYFGTADYGAVLDTKPGKEAVYGVDISNSDNRGYSVYYEAETKRIYIKHDTLHFVTDLDNTSIYDRNVFPGFTTGEVVLSLSFNTYLEQTAGFEIESILSTKGDALNMIDATDVKAPEIVLDNQNNLFNIAVNEPFEIFKAESKDLHPAGEVNAQVYYEYGTENQLYVPLVDGRFTPRKVGRYSIIYTAKDKFNNVATKIVECSAVNTSNGSIIDFNVTQVTSASAGTFVDLPVPTIISRNLEASYKVYALYEDGTLDEVVDNSFRLKRVGMYDIIYKYSDGIVNKVFSYELNSIPSDTPYIEELVLPQLLIKDSKMTLDDNPAISCSSKELMYLDCEVYAKVDGGSYGASPIDPDEYEVVGNSTTQFKYVYDGKLIAESEEIQVIDVGFKSGLHIGDYFIGDVDKNLTSRGLTLTASSGNENKVAFANALSLSTFSMGISFDSALATKAKCVNVILIDYYNPENQEKISFSIANGNLRMSINDGPEATIGTTTSTSLEFNRTNGYLSYEKPSTIEKVQFGENISNDKFYLGIEFEDVTDDTFINISSLNNHAFNTRTSDIVAPSIYAYPFDGNCDFGSELYISPMAWCDVFSPYLKKNYLMQLVITDLEGNATYAISEDGVVLDGTQDYRRSYKVLATKYGEYTAIYEASDQAYNTSGVARVNTEEIALTAYIVDDVAPVINVDTGMAYASFNSSVGVRGYSVSDNLSKKEDIKVRIYVISPIGEMTDVTVVKSFVANVRGDYKVIYYAEDEAENITTASYIVRVN